MCGRYELHNHPGAVALALGVPYPHDLLPRYNIAPGQAVPVVRVSAEGLREWALVRWGLVPRWAKDPAIGARMINARAETVATSKAFATPFHKHRCLIPADGFYAWQKLAGGRKQPVRIAMRDGATFAMAGLAERWLSPEGDVVDSCTVITVGANAAVRHIQERMPAIVPPEAYEHWLDHGAEPPLDLLVAYPAIDMTAYAVSMRVNATRNDDAALIAPVTPGFALVPDSLPPAPALAGAPRDGVPEQPELF